jgi:hypothetical protein
MLLVQFAGVNFMLFLCRRAAPFNYARNLAHQLFCPLSLLALACMARYATEAAGLGGTVSIPRFFASGILYTALTLCLALLVPFALGLRRGEITAQWRRLRSRREF